MFTTDITFQEECLGSILISVFKHYAMTAMIQFL